jgi:hypothetical protein
MLRLERWSTFARVFRGLSQFCEGIGDLAGAHMKLNDSELPPRLQRLIDRLPKLIATLNRSFHGRHEGVTRMEGSHPKTSPGWIQRPALFDPQRAKAPG